MLRLKSKPQRDPGELTQSLILRIHFLNDTRSSRWDQEKKVASLDRAQTLSSSQRQTDHAAGLVAKTCYEGHRKAIPG